MREQVTGKTRLGVGASIQGEENNSFSLLRSKHAAAMKRAEELLSGPDMYTANINDSLNCGKCNEKFFEFLKEMASFLRASL